MDISKAEILHLGWVTSRSRGCKYRYNNDYYMWITEDMISINKGVGTNKNSIQIFRGTLDCPDELNTLMYQLGITKI